VATNVAQVEVVVRGESQRPVHLGGRPPALYRDSLVGRAALRNNVGN
jgi:hypothetical protein